MCSSQTVAESSGSASLLIGSASASHRGRAAPCTFRRSSRVPPGKNWKRREPSRHHRARSASPRGPSLLPHHLNIIVNVPAHDRTSYARAYRVQIFAARIASRASAPACSRGKLLRASTPWATGLRFQQVTRGQRYHRARAAVHAEAASRRSQRSAGNSVSRTRGLTVNTIAAGTARCPGQKDCPAPPPLFPTRVGAGFALLPNSPAGRHSRQLSRQPRHANTRSPSPATMRAM